MSSRQARIHIQVQHGIPASVHKDLMSAPEYPFVCSTMLFICSSVNSCFSFLSNLLMRVPLPWASGKGMYSLRTRRLLAASSSSCGLFVAPTTCMYFTYMVHWWCCNISIEVLRFHLSVFQSNQSHHNKCTCMMSEYRYVTMYLYEYTYLQLLAWFTFFNIRRLLTRIHKKNNYIQPRTYQHSLFRASRCSI